MNVKEAVKAAKDYIAEIYADERVSGVGLEEVKFAGELPDTWDVTIGFFRSFPGEPTSLITALQNDPRRRVYKIVRIDDTNGRVVEVLHRTVGDGR